MVAAGVDARGTFPALSIPMVEHPRVLVADDDPEMLGAVADALVRRGYDVVRAESGDELVDQLASEGPFDLIVTDVAMPWMGGLKTLRSMRTVGVATPVVVMTALEDPYLPTQVRALGSNATLLRKPFELEELEGTIARLMSSRPPVGD
jgi:DNA-binding response OmpR family regulator